ncbi:MAG: site-2 protease family protein [Actinomycetota bacterium]|nr:site-2 protease family protein [Actinomycetota bacterium]
MRDDLRLGTIAGIPVGISWGLVVIVGAFTWLLASSRWPVTQPDLPTSAYWSAGFAAAALLFFSVLIHELGHAVVARRKEVGVEGITLWALGGATHLRNDSPNPGSELQIAAAGPLASVGVGVAFAGAYQLWSAVADPGLTGSVLRWLAIVNIALAVFNLLPALPLDGGRILAAAAWKVTGNRSTGTRVGAGVGRAMGVALMAFGVYESFVWSSTGGVWTAAIGWFIFGAATHERERAAVTDRLADKSVADLMLRDVPVAEDWMTVETFRAHLAQDSVDSSHELFGVRAFDGSITAVVTSEALDRVPEASRAYVRVLQIAEPATSVPRVEPTDAVTDALADHEELRVRPIAVVDHAGRLVGSIGPAQLLAAGARDRAGA